MNGNLPRNFTEKMEKLLGDEYDKFMTSYEAPRVYGLRINRLKLDIEQWKKLTSLKGELRPIPWTPDGLYYEEGERPGKHPHYHAGLYYIQEPSAMAPVELLDVKPGHRVLDLCAAPGGKSTQIAGKLQGTGVLVTNDNARERTKALAKNIELAGVRNAVVLNEEPAAIAIVFPEWFDRILVDAPCSGEGMFRKDESMIAEWEKHSIERCSVMQHDILEQAAAMLAPGGRIVYSTCTFSPEENEQQISRFLADHPDFFVEAVPHRFGWAAGRVDLAGETAQLDPERLQSIHGTVRLWPHLIEGEGHYAAVLGRSGKRSTEPGERTLAAASDARSDTRYAGGSLKREALKSSGKRHEKKTDHREERRAGKRQTRMDWATAGSERPAAKRTAPNARDGLAALELAAADPVELWYQFAEQFAADALSWPGRVVAYGSRVYIQPEELPSLDGLRVVRAGWYVGEAGRGRFEPSHPLAMGLTRDTAVRVVDWSSDHEQTLRFLKGETLFVEESEINIKDGAAVKGYILVCTDGYPIGWGKYAGGMIKNELPAGWRWM
ncbi:RsmB/NOP family class I SAM-dependent RNA methyltransferase [Paenibacillus sp. LHD-38]|uniref:RsmB/NOP family class I SAM-dependent RNA methyltransferase n=1 Tax=Paenibacillus sp. LHD-38 TaxID=3072143 RepID=UPI00280FA693|nr:RsmB/NOP family class I SAM-dependent RNA methyltransferase [Paenibacillus sp. LHD-38]MDQ8736759.1 RsmB/NOP family class I SAM-dependent RNA methyltransferase [Paenibacillus sp. LHD-38]